MREIALAGLVVGALLVICGMLAGLMAVAYAGGAMFVLCALTTA